MDSIDISYSNIYKCQKNLSCTNKDSRYDNLYRQTTKDIELLKLKISPFSSKYNMDHTIQ